MRSIGANDTVRRSVLAIPTQVLEPAEGTSTGCPDRKGANIQKGGSGECSTRSLSHGNSLRRSVPRQEQFPQLAHKRRNANTTLTALENVAGRLQGARMRICEVDQATIKGG